MWPCRWSKSVPATLTPFDTRSTYISRTRVFLFRALIFLFLHTLQVKGRVRAVLLEGLGLVQFNFMHHTRARALSDMHRDKNHT